MSVGCGSLKVTGGSPQEYKPVKMIIVEKRLSCFMLFILIVFNSLKMPYNGLRLKKVGDFEVQTFFWKPQFKCKINFH
jgi:hypothetical protein